MRRLVLAAVLIVAGPGAARADFSDILNEMTIVGGVDFGFKTLSLEVDQTRSSFRPSYVSLIPTLVLGYHSWYASASYDTSLGTEPGTGETIGSGGPTATTVDFSRSDSTFTLGYLFNSRFSAFIGHTRGISKFTETTFNTTLVVTHTDYTESGPFVGLAYNMPFGEKGSLGLSVAYAALDGVLDIVARPGGVTFSAKGDTTGLSYGATWSGPLTGSLGYRLGVKVTEYKMKDPADIVESYTNIFFGVVNYF